jgi:hypothetical protein
MFARLATRAPRAPFRSAFIRSNSSSTSSSATRVLQYASQAERPSTSIPPNRSPLKTLSNTTTTAAAEAAVPALWAVCAALVYTAWNRMDERSVGDNVEKLLIV